MKKRNLINFAIAGCLLILFFLYTAALLSIDRRSVGPLDSSVGFAAVNKRLHDFLGVNMILYAITDRLGPAVIIVAAGFAFLGFAQLLKRKSLLRVDRSILVLGGFYLLVFSAYLFFEFHAVNYRPVLINGILEVSYPSSTTLLVMCIIPTAMMQFHRRLKNKTWRCRVDILCVLFTVFMVVGRILSGVHWFTDILGGALLSAALVMLYYSVGKAVSAI